MTGKPLQLLTQKEQQKAQAMAAAQIEERRRQGIWGGTVKAHTAFTTLMRQESRTNHNNTKPACAPSLVVIKSSPEPTTLPTRIIPGPSSRSVAFQPTGGSRALAALRAYGSMTSVRVSSGGGVVSGNGVPRRCRQICEADIEQ